jgi:4-hydroxy-2-oxoheptanedioate aldolase
VLAQLRAGVGSYEEFAAGIEVLAMIETREALAAVEEILAVDGITGVYVGPNDLGISMGFAPGAERNQPEIIDAFRTIAAAAARCGKTSGIFCVGPAHAKRMVEMGFTMVTAASDARLLAQGAAEACREMQRS